MSSFPTFYYSGFLKVCSELDDIMNNFNSMNTKTYFLNCQFMARCSIQLNQNQNIALLKMHRFNTNDKTKSCNHFNYDINLPLFLRIILIFQGLLLRVRKFFLRIIFHFIVSSFTFYCNLRLHNFGRIKFNALAFCWFATFICRILSSFLINKQKCQMILSRQAQNGD